MTHSTDSRNVRKTAKPPRGDGRARPILSVTVPAALKAALERETAARKLPTLSAGVEQVLAEALAGSAGSRREDLTVAQLRRLNLRLSKLENDVRARDTLVVELLTTLTRAFLGHTPPPAEGDREALKRSAAERFDRLMDGVRRRLERGEAMLEQVPDLLDDLSRQPENAEGQPAQNAPPAQESPAE